MQPKGTHIIACIVFLVALSPIGLTQQKAQPEKIQEKPAGWYLKLDAVQREISFKAEDGWIIYGTYSVPNTYKQSERLPAVLLLAASMHSQTAWLNYVGWVKVMNTIPTLRIDIRGRGKSQGATSFVDFSQAQREKVNLDVKAAVDYLALQKEVDATRIGIAAEEFSAGQAIKGAMEDPRVRVFELISGLLDQKAIDLIASNLSKPVLYVVSNEDKASFDGVTKAYNTSGNPESEIWVEDGLGIGLTMGSVWRNKYTDQPIDRAIDNVEGEWMVSKLRQLGHIKEVTVQTGDGWTLYANLGMPDQSEGSSVPGVILLPTALADRASFANLERVLVRNGIAVLDLEWRGIGKSTGKGNYIDMALSEILGAPNDVQAGYKYLASQKGVDPERIGVLGAALAGKLAMAAAKENAKLKALAMLTPVTWPWEKDDFKTIASINRPVFLVTGDGFGELTKKFADVVAQDRRNTVLTYRGGIFGYLVFKVDRELEQTIAQWLKENLAAAAMR